MTPDALLLELDAEAVRARHATANRDALIREAHWDHGLSYRAIAGATGMPHSTIAAICNRDNV